MKTIRDINTALHQFEEASIVHSEATSQCDYKRCNKAYDVIMEAVTFLKKNDAIIRLVPFLDHYSPGVQTWAASYLLFIQSQEQEAIKTLEQVISTNGPSSFEAKIVLEEYRNGTLLPY